MSRSCAAYRPTFRAAAPNAGTTLARYTATYDNMGRRATVRELDNSLESYRYDWPDDLRIVTRTGTAPSVITYTYNRLHNRTSEVVGSQRTTITFDLANGPWVYTAPSGVATTHTLDKNGNVVVENAAGQLTTYSWDPENRLTGISYPDGTRATMAYDPAGMRREKDTPSGKILFVRDGQNVLVETDASLITQAHYTDLPGLWGGLVSQRRGGSSSFFGFDMTHNTRMLVDPAGLITDTRVYEPFGVEMASSGGTVSPFWYGGEEGYYRDTTDRIDVRRRILRPSRGRWMTRDPLGFEEGPGLYNLYVYADNNPVNLIDPSGLAPQGITAAWTAAIATRGYYIQETDPYGWSLEMWVSTSLLSKDEAKRLHLTGSGRVYHGEGVTPGELEAVRKGWVKDIVRYQEPKDLVSWQGYWGDVGVVFRGEGLAVVDTVMGIPAAVEYLVSGKAGEDLNISMTSLANTYEFEGVGAGAKETGRRLGGFLKGIIKDYTDVATSRDLETQGHSVGVWIVTFLPGMIKGTLRGRWWGKGPFAPRGKVAWERGNKLHARFGENLRHYYPGIDRFPYRWDDPHSWSEWFGRGEATSIKTVDLRPGVRGGSQAALRRMESTVGRGIRKLAGFTGGRRPTIEPEMIRKKTILVVVNQAPSADQQALLDALHAEAQAAGVTGWKVVVYRRDLYAPTKLEVPTALSQHAGKDKRQSPGK